MGGSRLVPGLTDTGAFPDARAVPPSRWLRPHAPLLLAALALISAGPARPPVELVESVPVESSLGNPALRPAREVWVEMIDGARRTLDLEEFYFTT